MNFEERVISVFKENLENGKGAAITPNSELVKDLDIDSLNALTILFGLEKEFSISLQESTFTGCRTVHDVIAGLEMKYPQLGGNRDAQN
jgi:acyl carrier protein